MEPRRELGKSSRHHKLFPCRVYGLAFEALLAKESEWRAGGIMVDLLALAHECACDAGLDLAASMRAMNKGATRA